ncbi:MAG TPA: NADH-ubiquinone oxidoreductase-F iron-sulfur binding region domain-containing protein [Polyangiaceae bacterium]|nr:NADH-ubiquinone oxidoreductase-F iron-sulfur binding region domain-containing protein [Polyangiaceae bacterium]
MSLDLEALVARHGHDPSRLVQLLHEVVAVEGRVSPAVMTRLAEALGLPRGQVEGVVGFYSFFGSEDRGRFRVLFSDNITDEMAGAHELRQRMLDAFRVQLGEVSAHDTAGLVSIGATSCTGLCDQGPAMLVNGRAIGRLTPARIGAITSLIRGNVPVDLWPENLFVIESHVELRDLLLSTPLAPGEAIAAALSRGAAATLDEVSRSGLRGRGGAGFPAGSKWAACAAAPSPERGRVIVCNADEGEPGTFKDRELLMHHADLLVEGMTVAALAVGANTGLLYLRGEYPFLVEPLLALLAERRRAGLLGASVLGVAGFDFDIELRLGAGAYVCGEESALLESLEGRRGIPRNRPPYPVTHGYKQRPTVVNNVETLIAAALVAAHGAGFLRAVGTPQSAGTKVLSVSGDVARPGVYELPFGVRVGEVLDLAGARDTLAVQVGGPSGTLLSARELERRIAFEDVPCAGAVMVFDTTRDPLAVVENFTRFFAHESCGFCTPCRVGTTLSAQMMERVVHGEGSRRDLKDLAKVSRLMRATSHCGLGTTAGNPVLDALEKFRPAFDTRLRSREVLPTFDLDASLAPAREVTARDDAGAHFEGREELEEEE